MSIPIRVLKRGEIYWVDFSGSKQYPKKLRRPVVILQNNVGNKFSPNTIVATCTATTPAKVFPVMVKIPKNICGLNETTWVDLASIMTLEKIDLLDKIGEVTEHVMKEIEVAIGVSLGLEDVSSGSFETL